MTILFAGGEDGDLLRYGGGHSVDTSTANVRRTGYTRCALKIASSTANCGWRGSFAASSAFWAGARGYLSNSPSNNAVSRLISFNSGTVTRLALTSLTNPSGKQPYELAMALVKISASGTQTTLATGTNFPTESLVKFDVHVDYGVAGSITLYLNGVAALTYSGDVTTDGETTLDSVTYSNIMVSSNFGVWWSEIIVATEDTRTMALVTLPPAANGAAFTWSGSYTDLADTTLNDDTACTTTSAGQVAQTTVSNASSIGTTAAILGVVVNARAQAGNTGGPSNAQLMIRSGGVDYVSSTVALPTGALEKISAVWTQDPNTSATWTAASIAAVGFNVGIKSIA